MLVPSSSSEVVWLSRKKRKMIQRMVLGTNTPEARKGWLLKSVCQVRQQADTYGWESNVWTNEEDIGRESRFKRVLARVVRGT